MAGLKSVPPPPGTTISLNAVFNGTIERILLSKNRISVFVLNTYGEISEGASGFSISNEGVKRSTGAHGPFPR